MKILLFGKDGQIGWELQRSLSPLGSLRALGRAEADLEDTNKICALIEQERPQVIVNAAAYNAVDKAETERERARAVNAAAVGVLAQQAHRLGAWLVHYSTDYVFDGEQEAAYTEDASTAPLSVYGGTKLEGEQLVRQHLARHLIFRTSWVFGAHGENFAKTILRLAREREQLSVVGDQFGAPTSAELVADVTALALYRVLHAPHADRLAGTYHLAARGSTSRHGYAQYILEIAKAHGVALRAAPEAVQAVTTEAYPLPACRPRNSRLDTGKLESTFALWLPDWRFHVVRLIEELAKEPLA